MIEFHCQHCNTKITVPDDHAGKNAKCPVCKGVAAAPMPDPNQTDVQTGGDDMASDGSAADTIQPFPQNNSDFIDQSPPGESLEEAAVAASISPKAIVGSSGGALLGAVIWAGIMKLTGYEIGYVAWLVGILAGVGAIIFTPDKRSVQIGVMAAMMAVAGVFAGKVIAFNWIVSDVVTPELISSAVDDDDQMFEMACSYMAIKGKIDGRLAVSIIEYYCYDENIPETNEMANGRTAVAEFVSQLTYDEKYSLAEGVLNMRVADYVKNESVIEKIKSSVDMIDIVFLVLAVMTAFKIGAGAVGSR